MIKEAKRRAKEKFIESLHNIKPDITRQTSKKRGDKNAEDIAQAKAKAAQIREQGLLEYKQQLLKELQVDRSRKIRVVFFLYIMSLFAVFALYFSNTDFAEIEKIIVRAMQFGPEEQDTD